MPKTPAVVNPGHLRAQREAAGLTRKEAAHQLGISVSTLQTWEAGESEPVATRLPLIANLYGVAIIDLLADGLDDSLAARRTRAGLLQRDVAEALGISAQRYGTVERGASPMPAAWVPVLATLIPARH